VWSVHGFNHAIIELSDHLSPFEISRANSFFRAEDRQAYVAAHVLLRLLIAQRFDVAPREINFKSTVLGKPILEKGPHFSISHTRNAVAVAICEDIPVGVDVEEVSERLYVNDLAADIMSAGELEIWNALDEHRKRSWFFERWVHKESVLKALGDGLSYPLAKLELTECSSSEEVVALQCVRDGQVVLSCRLDVGQPMEGAVSCISKAMVVAHHEVRFQNAGGISGADLLADEWRFIAQGLIKC
jgi:4'-phosphopantetheinyl transferase